MFWNRRASGRILVDGGLVNPVPVSLARAMGADIVIAVDPNSNRLGRHHPEEPETETPPVVISEWRRKLQENLGAFIPERADDDLKLPSILDVITSSINIMQQRISRSRMSGDPPDVIVSPRLSQLGLLDFHRSKEAIAEGKRDGSCSAGSSGSPEIAGPESGKDCAAAWTGDA